MSPRTSFRAILVALACAGLSSGVARAQGQLAQGQPAGEQQAQEKKVALAPVKDFEDLNLKKFDARSTTIDNAWYSLKPGMRFVYDGTTVEDDGTALPHRLVSTVTDLTKVIDGVRTVVVWENDYKDGKLVETEIAFVAQDVDGNVWRFGEYPEEWEGGKFVRAPAWVHGREGARAGISMKAKPELGLSYSQGWGPAVNWTDRGRVDQVGQKTCVKTGCYEDVLVIAETSKEEKDAAQLKYYARGVGNVRVGWRGKGEKTKETLELVEVTQLSPKELAEARAKALELDKRAYKRAKKAYEGTPPAVLAKGGRP